MSKEKNVEKRRFFSILKDSLQRRVEEFHYPKEITDKLIRNMRPTTENGENICLPCDVISMVPVEKIYGDHHNLNYTHECEIRGGNQLGRYNQ